MKKLLFTQRSDTPHWVGDGFPVRTIFSYQDDTRALSPFLLMDYGGPTVFEPSPGHARGVGEHPHRGFETVTIVYAGEVEHRDSAGGGGRIGPGDVQWMTAASGLVHEEKHSRAFSERGGPFEMVQLWVNLPARDKMAKPRYQGIASASIPELELPEGAGTLRVIAGRCELPSGAPARAAEGPARTFTPIELWDVRLRAGKRAKLRVPGGHTTLVFVLQGRVRLGSGEELGEAELAGLTRREEGFALEALEETKLLVLAGEPIEEPVIGYGPFVMNTPQQIREAFRDYETGRMGQIVSGSDPAS